MPTNIHETIGQIDAPPIMLMLLILVPVAAAAVVALLGPGRADLVRKVSLVATLMALAIATGLAVIFVTLQRES